MHYVSKVSAVVQHVGLETNDIILTENDANNTKKNQAY